jgi:hypothetical protein
MARYRPARQEGRSLFGVGTLAPPKGWTRIYGPDGRSWRDVKDPGRISDLPPELRPSGPLTTLAQARAAVARRSLRGT